ncbi:hypothetical protein CLOM_g21093 [Closterium sp. NIES-68]|nr:hypothetical protein CLOM_g21093 [Closterium sp. NIES-68]GJP61593.1 hypothetical protein CLOP_g18736 [Closterium sp. NIES-67]
MASLSQSQPTAVLRAEAFRVRRCAVRHPPCPHFIVSPFLRPHTSPNLPAAPVSPHSLSPLFIAVGRSRRSRRVAVSVSAIHTRQDGRTDAGADAGKPQRAARGSKATSVARQGDGVTGRGTQVSGMQGVGVRVAGGSGEQEGDGAETTMQRPSEPKQQQRQQQQQEQQSQGAQQSSSFVPSVVRVAAGNQGGAVSWKRATSLTRVAPLNRVASLGSGGFQGLGSGIQGLGSGIQEIGSGIQGLGSGIQGRASAVRSRLQGSAMEVGSQLQGRAYGVGSTIQDTAAVVGGAIQGRAVEVGSTIQGKAVEVGSTIQDTAVVVGGAIQGKAVEVGSTIQDTAVVVGSRIQGKAVQLQERAVEVGSSIQGRAVEVGSSIQGRAVEVGSSIQDRAVLLQGKAVEVSSTLQDVVSEVGQVVTEVGVTIQEKQQEIAKVVQHTAEDVERSLPPPAQGALRTAGTGLQHLVAVVAPVVDRIPVTKGQLAGAAVVVVLFIKAVEQWWYQFQQDSRGSTHFDIPERIRVEAPSPLPPPVPVASTRQQVDVRRKEPMEWVNMLLRKVFRIYRTGLERWMVGILQPIIDETPKPRYVRRVRIKQFFLGDEPPSLRSIERRTSRRGNDLQYHVGLRYTGGMRMLLEVPVDASMGLSTIPLTIPIPVGVRNFDIDAELWVKLKLIPVEPWVGALTWAFVTMPKVKLTLAPFRVVNLMAIPFLSSYLQALLTEELPSRFLRPNSKRVDLLKDRPLPPDPSQREFREGQVAGGTLGFAGELQVTVIAAQRIINLPLGDSNPYVLLELGQQVARSKRNSETSLVGPAGYPIWNQDFVLLVVDPSLQRLSVKLRGSLGLFYVDFGHGTVRLDSLQDTVPTDVWVPLRLQLPFGRKACGRVKMRLTYKAFVEEEEERDVETFDRPYSEAESDTEGGDALATISRLKRFVADVADSAAPPELLRILENVRVGEIPRVVDLERLSSDVAKLSDLARALEVALFKDVNRLAELPRLSDLPKMKEFSVLAELASIRADMERLAQAARALELGAELEKRVKVDLSRIDLDLSSVDLPKWDEWMAVPRRALPQSKDLAERYRLLLPDGEERRRQRAREEREQGGGGVEGERRGRVEEGEGENRGQAVGEGRGGGAGGGGGAGEGSTGRIRRIRRVTPAAAAEVKGRRAVGRGGAKGGGSVEAFEWKEALRVFEDVWGMMDGAASVLPGTLSGTPARPLGTGARSDTQTPADGPPGGAAADGRRTGAEVAGEGEREAGGREGGRRVIVAGTLRGKGLGVRGAYMGRNGDGDGRTGATGESDTRGGGGEGWAAEGGMGISEDGTLGEVLFSSDVDGVGASVAPRGAESAATATPELKGWTSPSLQTAGSGTGDGIGVGDRDGRAVGDAVESGAIEQRGKGGAAGTGGRGREWAEGRDELSSCGQHGVGDARVRMGLWEREQRIQG